MFSECIAQRDILIVDRCRMKEVEFIGGDWSQASLRLNDSLNETSKLRLSKGGLLDTLPWLDLEEITDLSLKRDWQINSLSRARLKALSAQLFNGAKGHKRPVASPDTSSWGHNYSYGNQPLTTALPDRFYPAATPTITQGTRQLCGMLKIDQATVKEADDLIELMLDYDVALTK